MRDIIFRGKDYYVETDVGGHYRWMDYDVTVIGNIHDNPELLEA